VGGSATIFMLMVANLVGFGVGARGTAVMLRKLVYEDGGATLVAAALGYFFVATQLIMCVDDARKRSEAHTLGNAEMKPKMA
jgi:hypothetical protein